MTHPTPERKATHAQKAKAPRCARCNRKLEKPGTVVPGLGVVGPECESHVAARLMHLRRAGLSELLDGGVRVVAHLGADGTYAAPTDALAGLQAIADRAGRLMLDCRLDPVARVWTISIRLSTLEAFVRRSGVEA